MLPKKVYCVPRVSGVEVVTMLHEMKYFVQEHNAGIETMTAQL